MERQDQHMQISCNEGRRDYSFTCQTVRRELTEDSPLSTPTSQPHDTSHSSHTKITISQFV